MAKFKKGSPEAKAWGKKMQSLRASGKSTTKPRGKNMSKGEKRKKSKKTMSVVELAGVIMGADMALTSGGSTPIQTGGLPGITDRALVGFTGYNPEYGWQPMNLVPTYGPMVAGWVVEKVLKKMGLNHKITKELRL